MLEITARNWFSWNFDVVENDTVVAHLEMSSWRQRAEIVLHDMECRLYRDGMKGPFLLETDGAVYATAVKESVLRNSFVVELADRTYRLEKPSAFSRTFVLSEEGAELGRMKGRSAFSRKAQASFPEEIPLSVQIFLIWLVLIIWKREADSV